jgi:acyl dehydratase
MPFTEDELAARVGRELPGGTYTIEPWRAWLVADAVLAEPPALKDAEGQVAHPLFAWLAATGAMGITWDELFSWFGATAADGPVFGEHETTLHRPLRIGATYRVSGRIVSAERKVGRRTGPFDVVGYALDLHDTGGGHVATCWNSIVFPRRSA